MLVVSFFFSIVTASLLESKIKSTNHDPGHQIKSEGILFYYLCFNPAHVCRNPDYEQPPFLSLPEFRDEVIQERKGRT